MRCPVCLSTFPDSEGPGRPRVYCSDRCRNANHNRERVKLLTWARKVKAIDL